MEKVNNEIMNKAIAEALSYFGERTANQDESWDTEYASQLLKSKKYFVRKINYFPSHYSYQFLILSSPNGEGGLKSGYWVGRAFRVSPTGKILESYWSDMWMSPEDYQKR